MSDATLDDEERRYKNVVPFQAINAERHNVNMKLLRRGLYASMGLNVLLGFGIANIMPLKTYVPIYGFNNEAGNYDQTTSTLR